MEDSKLIQLLNALAARSMLLECQVLALRRLLDKEGVLADADVERMIEKVVETYKDVLSPKRDASERLEAFLQKFEGPIQ